MPIPGDGAAHDLATVQKDCRLTHGIDKPSLLEIQAGLSVWASMLSSCTALPMTLAASLTISHVAGAGRDGGCPACLSKQ